MTRRALLCFAFLCILALPSCERKAPGPFDCQNFAEKVLGAERGDPRLTPIAEQRLDDLTLQCLTTPYDRQLIECVQRTGLGHACFVEFRRRTGRTLPEL
ncbi:MAG TPA: hypothetical protein VGM29_02715 [Polyangiaceae bacterium]